MRVYTSLGPFRPELEEGKLTSGAALMDRALELGFDGLEVGLSLRDRPGADRILADLPYERVTFHSAYVEFTLASVNRYVREGCARQLIDELAFALERGRAVVTFHPGVEGKKLGRARSHEHLIASLAPVMEAFGPHLESGRVTLGLENMDWDEEKLCRTEEEIQSVLDAFPALSLTCDLAHLAMNEADIGHFIDRFHGRIRHLHVSGYRPDRSHSKVSLEESVVDLRPFIARFADQDIVACIENATLELALASKRVLDEVRGRRAS